MKAQLKKKEVDQTESTEKYPAIGVVFNTQGLFQKLFTLPLPFDVRLQLKNIRTHISGKLENFAETRLEIYKKFGTTEDEKSWKLKPEHQEEAEKELKSLFAVSLKVSFDKIPESAFGDNLSVFEVEALSWMIEEGI